MKRNLFVVAPAIAVLAMIGTASAQKMSEAPSYWEQSEKAPENAFEVTVGTGYTQGFGQIQKGSSNNINDVANAGIAFDLGVGYRITPKIGVAVAAQYQEFSVAQSGAGTTAARGFLAGVDGTYYFDPYVRFSPWVRAGTGYRMLWSLSNGPTALFHGFDLVRLAIGFDARVSEDIAMGPLIGADLDVYVWQWSSGSSNSSITDPRVSTYIYGGLQGRFDIGGARTSESSSTTYASVK